MDQALQNGHERGAALNTDSKAENMLPRHGSNSALSASIILHIVTIFYAEYGILGIQVAFLGKFVRYSKRSGSFASDWDKK